MIGPLGTASVVVLVPVLSERQIRRAHPWARGTLAEIKELMALRENVRKPVILLGFFRNYKRGPHNGCTANWRPEDCGFIQVNPGFAFHSSYLRVSASSGQRGSRYTEAGEAKDSHGSFLQLYGLEAGIDLKLGSFRRNGS